MTISFRIPLFALTTLSLIACGGSSSDGGDREASAASYRIEANDFNDVGILTLENGDKIVFDENGDIALVNGQAPEKSGSTNFEGPKAYIVGNEGVAFAPDFVAFARDEGIVDFDDYSDTSLPTSETTLTNISYEYIAVDAGSKTFALHGTDLDKNFGSVTVTPEGKFNGKFGDQMAIENGTVSGHDLSATAVYSAPDGTKVNGNLTGQAGTDLSTGRSVFGGNIGGQDGDVAFAGIFYGVQ